MAQYIWEGIAKQIGELSFRKRIRAFSFDEELNGL